MFPIGIISDRFFDDSLRETMTRDACCPWVSLELNPRLHTDYPFGKRYAVSPAEICCMTTLGYMLTNFNSASLSKIKLFYNFATQIGKVFGGSDRKITSPWQFSPEVPGGK